ncbi:hypothetical protein BO71DRAFT_409903 [Aspergillus ellipticus CBS 707.79]|uniref:Uncharacterized protein n=1 Tax=Aspergillus ellipticus CBS 707.79 TaxID=1448320 RepID=A0A319D8W1_9EURO|nr:hypothetical protein BO71DRAFT_409903 [Aspergillus ellipticus CBS 707.79]
MQLTTKVSVALLGAFAAVGEANNHGFHARNLNFHPAGYSNETVSTSYVSVYPTPLKSSPAVAPIGASSVPHNIVGSSSAVTPAPVPLSTGVYSSAPVSAAASAGDDSVSTDYETVTSTKDVTLTYTLGTGASKTVVTTTIHRTVTDVETVYVTPSASASSTAGVSAASSAQDTTVTSTSTAYATYTLYAVPSSSGAAGSASAVASHGDSCAPVTVTVHDTVTVTATPAAVSTPDSVVKVADVETSSSVETSTAAEASAESTSSAESTTQSKPTAVPTAPYGQNNGTFPFPSGAARPTGFQTSSKAPAFPSHFRRVY